MFLWSFQPHPMDCVYMHQYPAFNHSHCMMFTWNLLFNDQNPMKVSLCVSPCCWITFQAFGTAGVLHQTQVQSPHWAQWLPGCCVWCHLFEHVHSANQWPGGTARVSLYDLDPADKSLHFNRREHGFVSQEMNGQFDFSVEKPGVFHGFTAWFTVRFESLEKGGAAVELNTGPNSEY